MVSDKVVTVMISVPSRDQVRQRTIDGLHRCGLAEPRVFICNNLPLGKANHRANTLQALEYEIANGKSHILLLEDDLDFSSSLADSVFASIESGKEAVSLYVSRSKSFYPRPIREYLNGQGERPPDGVYPVCNSKSFYGGQAILLDRNVISDRLQDYRDANRYFDNWFRTALDLWFYFPNPVDHYGASLASTWSSHRHPHRSGSYGR